MWWLFIDTHERGQVRLALFGERGAIREKTVLTRIGPVPAAARFFSAAMRARATGVCVVEGPGPFSAIRGGVLLANVLARLLRVPLVGVTAVQAQSLSTLRDEFVKGRYKPRGYVAPVYDAEPNIGPAAS